MKREFASLSPKEALQVAIFIEERNADIYRQFAELFDGFDDPESAEIASTFWDMAKEEHRHGADLQQRYKERYGQDSCAITDDEIRDTIEVPKFNSGSIFAIARAQVSRAPRNKALEVALAAEQSALKFYTRLVEFTDDPELRSLYQELASGESDHTRHLERQLRIGRGNASVTQA
ncbi:MAG TPA: ferritin family protein [Terriglobales bacterium]|nr:ferritin family protein [Terriglobales bacterium]